MNSKKTTIISLAYSAIISIIAIIFLILYFQASREIETQKIFLAALQTDFSAAKSDLAKEAARTAELKSDLNSAQIDARSLAEKSAKLQSDIQSKNQALEQEKTISESAQAALQEEKARPPAVPVRLEMRRSAMNRGLVGMFTNTSARQLPLLIAMKNPTTQAVKQFSLQVAPGTKVQLGYQEGWEFASGDLVLLRSAGFEDVRNTIP